MNKNAVSAQERGLIKVAKTINFSYETLKKFCEASFAKLGFSKLESE